MHWYLVSFGTENHFEEIVGMVYTMSNIVQFVLNVTQIYRNLYSRQSSDSLTISISKYIVQHIAGLNFDIHTTMMSFIIVMFITPSQTYSPIPFQLRAHKRMNWMSRRIVFGERLFNDNKAAQMDTQMTV